MPRTPLIPTSGGRADEICDDCLSTYDAERTTKLATAGKATLAAMRASNDDPARSQEARAKKREKSKSTSLAMRAWEREHGRDDPELYDLEVLPRINQMIVPQLMKLTGLSQFHCWKVRKGERGVVDQDTAEVVAGPLIERLEKAAKVAILRFVGIRSRRSSLAGGSPSHNGSSPTSTIDGPFHTADRSRGMGFDGCRFPWR